ncbi:MAG TPA: hypothetical protein VKR43_10530 [Bryobacteraceae bacterium]|nr:hypothetical protein [Bryobacteraceae bacterium]
MAEPITIPISILEVTIRYQKAAVRLLVDRAEVIQALFDVFGEYDPNADDLEVVSSGKTTEQGIKFRLSSQRINLFFGATHCKFTKEAPMWAEADKILSILLTFLDTLKDVSGIAFSKKNSVLSLHLQPKVVPFQKLLLPFIASEIQHLEKEPLRAMAVVARWPGRRITLDGSAQLANGIFVQMERDYAADVSFDNMKQLIYQDEVAILKLLNVEEVEE